MEYNTVTFTASDGMEVVFPFEFLVARGAIVADKINGEDIASLMGCSNQLWIPGFPAKYFLRDIVDIRFTNEKKIPKLPDFNNDGHDYTNRPNISCRAPYVGYAGEVMLFEGWADDFDKRIVGVEFSLDEGISWTRHRTEHADAIRWLWWRFEWKPLHGGTYTMWVRAVNEDGVVSPVSAVHTFEILDR